MRPWFYTLMGLLCAGAAQAEDAKLTLGVPLYVHHPDARPGTRAWNQGWFRNEGVFADINWPMAALGEDTQFRAGFSGGVFDNSIYRTSVFAGGVAEVETYVTKHMAWNLGAYVAAITGYEGGGLRPAFTPYVSTSYAVTDSVSLGLRGFWLPARTLGDFAASDAYVAAATVGIGF